MKNLKKFLLILLAFIFVGCTFENNNISVDGCSINSDFSIEWAKCIGGSSSDRPCSIIQTSDGGYLIAGNSNSSDGDVSGNHGGGDIWIVKLNSGGNIEWQKPLGGMEFDWISSIQQLSDGGYIIGGMAGSNDGDVSGNHGNGDEWVVKLNSTGNIEWQKCIGGSRGDYLGEIRQTSDGGYIVAGTTFSEDGDVSGNKNLALWIVKLNPSGAIEWQKSYPDSKIQGISLFFSVVQTGDDGYLASGHVMGDVSGNHGETDIWILKFFPDGNIEWQKCIGGSQYDAITSSILPTNDGGYILAGSSNSKDGDVKGNNGDHDAWIVKINIYGNILWQKSFGGSGYDAFTSIEQTGDGGYILAGNTKSDDWDVEGNHGDSDSWIVKISNNGNILWQKCLGGSGYDAVSSIKQTIDGGFIVASFSESNDLEVSGNHGGGDIWIVKLKIK